MDNTDLDLGLHTVAEVAKMLRCTPRTIFKYVTAGKLHAVKIGKNYLVSKADVVKLLSEMRSKPQLSESALEARRENIKKAREKLFRNQRKEYNNEKKQESRGRKKSTVQADQSDVQPMDTSDAIREPEMFAGENPPALIVSE